MINGENKMKTIQEIDDALDACRDLINNEGWTLILTKTIDALLDKRLELMKDSCYELYIYQLCR
jgi:hypothetical protein